ncbi:MAG: rhodanese-like domain-containing protein [Anaerolineae bacterium]|nr:rhodanese-like domain-containing protein [Anaerolineae bacterium]
MSRSHVNQRRQAKKKKQAVTLLLGGIIIIIASIFIFSNTQPSGEITAAQAFQMRQEGAFILDVREQFEWDEYHIPGANLIPLGELAGRVKELPEDQDIIVVCRSGNRSQTGRDILLNAGFTSVTSMAGGVNDWMASGYETVTGP